MKISCIRYAFSKLASFEDYQKKITAIAEDKKSKDVDLILFPEYSGMELLGLFEEPLVNPYLKLDSLYKDYLAFYKELAMSKQIHICSGTTLFHDRGKRYNRAHLFTKEGMIHTQDKCMSTRFEEEKEISQGSSCKVFNVEGVQLGILVCYDIEFPYLARGLCERGAQLILCPSYTDDWQGYYRVHVSSRARALENQCIVATSVLHGDFEWIDEKAFGYAGVYGPPDGPFPDSGVISQGEKDAEACLNFNFVKETRQRGSVKNYHDWPLQNQVQFF